MPISNWACESPQNSQPLVGFLWIFELERITDHGTDQGLQAEIILVTRGIADTHDICKFLHNNYNNTIKHYKLKRMLLSAKPIYR